ncbi:MAG: 30S ribosomal protein S8 [Candidatus Brocadiaceae bacterium]
MTDPISDMLTRIRNANMIRRESVDIPFSKIKWAILHVAKENGFINEIKEIFSEGNKKLIRVYLKYGPLKQQIITNIERKSKSSRRMYKKAEEVEKIFGGIGTAIYSTSKGIISDGECRRLKIGGELLCVIS